MHGGCVARQACMSHTGKHIDLEGKSILISLQAAEGKATSLSLIRHGLRLPTCGGIACETGKIATVSEGMYRLPAVDSGSFIIMSTMNKQLAWQAGMRHCVCDAWQKAAYS